jgi:hypothetical protein
LSIFTSEIYVKDNRDKDTHTLLNILLVLAIIYSTIYDFIQLYKHGLREYFSDLSNYADQLYIWCGIANAILHTFQDPQSLECKVVMIIISLLQIIKTFSYLRIFNNVSYIVTMLAQVTADLRVFGFFYFVLIFLFAQMYNVLGVSNHYIHPVASVRENPLYDFY